VGNKTLSVIIPAVNEEKMIRACIESAQRVNPLEIIVVDGGSMDRTRDIAEDAGAIVILSTKGRGIQMNKGASFAKGNILLFLHADVQIPNCNEELLSKSFADCHSELVSESHIGGFFRLKFDDNSISTKLVEFFANLRARLFSLPYGDQAVFIKRDVFDKVGGFKEYPFLEDLDIAIRVRKFGRLRYIPFLVVASSRRIKKGYPLSPIIVSLRNVVIASLFLFGLSPFRLIKLYR